jgi:hypothetical protein
MKGKKWMVVLRTSLLVCALLLSTTALAGTLGYYNWSANTTGVVGEFTNSGSGGGVKANTVGSSSIGLYGSATGSTAQATRGYNSGSGYGVYGRSVKGTGVYGENNSTTSGYGGYFTGFNGLKAYTTATNGYAGWFTATGASGFGVRAQSSASTGYGVYSTGGQTGVYGLGEAYGGKFDATSAGGSVGVYAASNNSGGDAARFHASGTSNWGVNAWADGDYGHGVNGDAYGPHAYGGTFYSEDYTGLYAEGNGGYYDLYAPNSAYIGGTIIPPKGGLAFLARYDGDGTLQAGDLVVFRGFDPAALGRGAVLAAKAGAASGVVLGVVQGAYVVDEDARAPTLPDASPAQAKPVLQEESLVAPAPMPEGEEPRVEGEVGVPASLPVTALPEEPPKAAASEPASGRFVEGPVEAGQYMVVSYAGLVQVTVTAKTPIQAGDWIVFTPDGSVTGVPARSYSKALDRGYTIVGRALEQLQSGTGKIYVQVNLR